MGLSSRSRATPYAPTETLSDPLFVRKAILEALTDGDFESVVTIYQAHLRVLNRTRTAAQLGVSRQHIHRLLRRGGANPRLKTFAAFMRVLKYEVRPHASAGS